MHDLVLGILIFSHAAYAISVIVKFTIAVGLAVIFGCIIYILTLPSKDPEKTKTKVP